MHQQMFDTPEDASEPFGIQRNRTRLNRKGGD